MTFKKIKSSVKKVKFDSFTAQLKSTFWPEFTMDKFVFTVTPESTTESVGQWQPIQLGPVSTGWDLVNAIFSQLKNWPLEGDYTISVTQNSRFIMSFPVKLQPGRDPELKGETE